MGDRFAARISIGLSSGEKFGLTASARERVAQVELIVPETNRQKDPP